MVHSAVREPKVSQTSVLGQSSNECLKGAIANVKILDLEALEVSIASKCIHELSELFGRVEWFPLQKKTPRAYTGYTCIRGSKKQEIYEIMFWILHRPKVSLPGRLFRSETGF
jgi:hypothetical protein